MTAPAFLIQAPDFMAGFVLGQTYAPAIGYMRAWSLLAIRRYCAVKGWHIQPVQGLTP